MLATVRSIQHVAQWLLLQQRAPQTTSSSSSQQQQQNALLQYHALWLPSLKLLVECLLLVPTLDMASSCLQLITWLMQQVNAARRVPRRPPTTTDAAQPDSTAAGAAGASWVDSTAATVTLKEMLPLALKQLGPAVYHAVQHTADLKQRRQLLQMWANAVEATLQEDSE
jgi:hypothetical protein